jgi:hypothetical protein
MNSPEGKPGVESKAFLGLAFAIPIGLGMWIILTLLFMQLGGAR